MKKIFTLEILLNAVAISVRAQSAEDSVKTTINRLFEGMKTANAEMITNSFADSAILQTIAPKKEGGIQIRNESVPEFAKSISQIKPGAADEQISFETIKIDADLAIAWTPYKFYFNGKFSHCGVNSFQLVRIKGEWKIQYLIDTRRRQGCE